MRLARNVETNEPAAWKLIRASLSVSVEAEASLVNNLIRESVSGCGHGCFGWLTGTLNGWLIVLLAGSLIYSMADWLVD